MKKAVKKREGKSYYGKLIFISILVFILSFFIVVKITGLTVSEESNPLNGNEEESDLRGRVENLEQTGDESDLDNEQTQDLDEDTSYTEVSEEVDHEYTIPSEINENSANTESIEAVNETKNDLDVTEDSMDISNTSTVDLTNASTDLNDPSENTSLLVNLTETNDSGKTWVSENVSDQIETNENFSNREDVITERGNIIINEPVRWTMTVVNKSSKITIPKEANNITIKDKKSKETFFTGNSIDIPEENFFSNIIKWLSRMVILGYSVKDNSELISEKNDYKEIDVSNLQSDDIVIEFYTEAPESNEEKTQNGKIITISASDGLNYTDILAYTYLENVEINRIKFYHSEKEVEFESFDNDSDGLIDYIEWTVPHLSTQEYHLIIVATSAEHLSENRTFLEDIFEQIKELDGTWSPQINPGEYVRVTFEENLTSDRDIKIYAKSDSVSNIEVYEKDGEEPLAVFYNVSDEGFYKIFLTNLIGEEDSFDLKISGGSVQFDFITDPIDVLSGNGAFNTSAHYAAWSDGGVTDNDGAFVHNTTYGLANSSLMGAVTAKTKVWTGEYKYISLGTLNANSIAKLNFSWRKEYQVAQPTAYLLNISLVKPDNSQITVWTENSATFNSWQNVSLNLTSNLSATGNYQLRLTCDLTTPGTNGAQAFCFYDELYLFFTDTTAPTVFLNSPTSNNATNNQTIFFNCSANDSGTLTNATLYGNWSTGWHANETKSLGGSSAIFNVSLTEGVFSWNCRFCDADGNCGFNNTNNTLIVERIAPKIYLENPSDNYIENFDSTPNFNFNVSENNLIAYCNLWVNNSSSVVSSYGVNSNVINATSSTITANHSLANADYLWWINCTDAAGNVNKSQIWNLSVNVIDAAPRITINSPSNDATFPTANSSLLNWTVSDESGSMEVWVYGSNDTNKIGTSDSILYHKSLVSEGTYIYNWTTPITSQGLNTPLIFHFDQIGYEGENGTLSKDFAGGDNNATLTSVVWNSSGKIGGALEFNGVLGTKAVVADSNSLDLTDFTISLWFMKKGSATGGGFAGCGDGAIEVLTSKGEGGGDGGTIDSNWLFAVDDTVLAGCLEYSGGSDATTLGTTTIEQNRWYHAVMVANSSTLSIYLNGNYENSVAVGGTIDTNVVAVGIGAGLETATNTQDAAFNGSIDELIIFNRSLTLEEIRDLYRLSAGRYYWKVNATDGTSFNNSGEYNFVLGDFQELPYSPTVSLNSPEDNSISTSANVSFNCSATDTGLNAGLRNLTLYGNWTGWAANESINVSGLYNSTLFTINLTDQQSYKWNCRACDNSSNCSYASQNRTFFIDTTADLTSPTVSLNSPGNESVSTSTSISFNCSAIDENLKNSTLFFSSLGAGSGQGINLVQNITGKTTSTGTGVRCNLGVPATSGNLLVTTVASDKDAGTYTPHTGFTMIQTTSATSVSGGMAYKIAEGGETHVDWNQSSSSAAGIACWVGEFSGTALTNVLDVSIENETYSSGDVVSESISTGTTLTTSQDAELAVALVAADTFSSVNGARSWSNSFTEITVVDAGAGLSVSIKNLSSTGIQESTYACTDTGDQMYAMIATFKSGGGLSWHANETVNISGASNSSIFLKNFSDNQTLFWNCYVCDMSNNCNFSAENNTFDINTSYVFVDQPPVVTLNSPENSSLQLNTSIIFNCSFIDDVNLKNITLYGNWSGWGANETMNITGRTNYSSFNISLADQQRYTWNCYACDNESKCSFANQNRTFLINTSADVTAPSVTLIYPSSNVISNSTTLNFNCSATDSEQLRNATLYFDGGEGQSIHLDYFQENATYSGSYDAKIGGGTAQNTNFETVTTIEVDYQDSTTGEPEYGLFRWNTSAIPTNAVVSEVNVTLYVSEVGNNFDFYEVKKDWVESEVTWRIYRTGSSWEVEGATGSTDVGNVALGTVPGSSTGSKVVSLNAAGINLVQNWIGNQSSNNGLILKGTGTSGTAYYSSENSNSANRPKLSIKYTLGSTWHANETKNMTGSSNSTLFSKFLIDNESYTWNCLVCDISGNCGFSANNNSFDVNTSYVPDVTGPLITIISPSSSIYSTRTIWFNASVNENVSSWIINYNGTNLSLANVNTSVDIEEGNYHLFLYANDSSGNWGLNDSIWFNVSLPPRISFVYPSLNNGTISANKSLIVNVSISENYLNSLKNNWNGINYTLLNSSTKLLLNLNNVSAIGENSTYAVDASGNHNASFSGNAVWNDSGKYGKGVYFDGDSDFLSIDDSADWDFTTRRGTISFWMKPTDLSSVRGVISQVSNDQNWAMYIYPDGRLAIGRAGVNEMPSAAGTISTGNWYHVVIVSNSTTNSDTEVYVNGIQKVDGSTAAWTNPTNALKIGGYVYSSTNYYFKGNLDEIQVWNRSLSVGEINQLYMSNLQKINSSEWQLYVNQSKNSTALLDDGLYSYSLSAYDFQGNENTTDIRQIRINSVFDLNVIYPQEITYAFFPTAINYTTESFASLCWYSNDAQNFSAVPAGNNFTGVQIYEGLNSFTVYCNDSYGNLGSDSFNFIVDTTAPNINFIYPTLEDGAITSNRNININVSYSNDALSELKYNWNGTNYTLLNSSTKLLLNLNNVSAIGENSTYAVDASGNHNASFSGDASWNDSGKYGKSVYFDGNADFLSIADSADWDFTTKRGTISFWMKPTDLTSVRGVISQVSNDQNWAMYVYTDGRLAIGRAGVNEMASAAGTIATGNWYHIVIVSNSTSNADTEVYVNGIQKIDGSTAVWTNPTNALKIGGYVYTDINYYFKGNLDELQIWNRSLSVGEINQIYMSNLKKINYSEWQLYVNQSKNSTSLLEYGNYSYSTSAKDGVGNENVTGRQINVNSGTAYAIDLSASLSNQIKWNLASLPAINQSADGNNASEATEYIVNISTEGGLVDVYIRANSDLMNDAMDILNIGNETYSYNNTESSVPSEQKFSLTTNFADNKIGDGLGNGQLIYLKFFLSAPSQQPAGTYNNTLEIKAVSNGQAP